MQGKAIAEGVPALCQRGDLMRDEPMRNQAPGLCDSLDRKDIPPIPPPARLVKQEDRALLVT